MPRATIILYALTVAALIAAILLCMQPAGATTGITGQSIHIPYTYTL